MLDSLLIRADASVEIGTGHVMRCLALAQVWQEECGEAYVRGHMPRRLKERLIEDGVEPNEMDESIGTPADAAATVQRADEVGASWIVVDGYHFGTEYQRSLQEAGHHVLFIDDYGHAGRYEVDLLLNQNIDAEENRYADRADHTDLLLGPQFALLRKEFWPWREPRRKVRSEADHVLVTLGGTDPENLTTEVIRAVAELEASDVRVTVVIGGSNPHEESSRAAAESVGVPITVVQNVNGMAGLMAKADLAVSAGGSTCWELAFMGIPNVIMVLAENQQEIARGLDEAGVAINLGWHESIGKSEIVSSIASLLRRNRKRRQMAQKAQALVDGRGAGRVLSKMRSTVRTASHHQFRSAS